MPIRAELNHYIQKSDQNFKDLKQAAGSRGPMDSSDLDRVNQ